MQSVISIPSRDTESATRTLALTVTRSDGWKAEHRLGFEATVIIGSAGHCGLALAGEDVSALHCSLRWDATGLWLEDWGSQSGTFLDGQRIANEVPVEFSHIIRVGGYSIQLCHDPAADASGDMRQCGARTEEPAPSRQPAAGDDSLSCELPEGLPADRACDGISSVGRPARAGRFRNENKLRCPEGARPDAENSEMFGVDLEGTAPAPAAVDPTGQLTSPDWRRPLPADGPAAVCDQETFEMLRAEVAQLEFELAERDAQLAEALASPPNDREASDEEPIASPLLQRVESLLDELDRCDQRMATMEELLRTTEEANRDEREERRQMESWLGEIESVFGEHQATWNAEVAELRNRTAAITAERDQLLQQLTHPAGEHTPEQDPAEAGKLRLQVDHLRRQLDEAAAETTRQKEALERCEARLAEASEAESQLREDHLKLAAERAALSRLRAEITTQQAEHQQRSSDANTDIDSRVRGFRQHLREMDDQEQHDQPEQTAHGLPGRIARLWKRIEARR